MNKLTKKLSTLILSSAVLFSGTHINAGIFENNHEYDLNKFGKITIKNHSEEESKECFEVGNFRCEITIYENSYSINFIDMRSGCEFGRRWMIEDKCKITPELILTDIIQEISCYTNSVIQPKITKTRQKINLLAKEDKRKEETKPKRDLLIEQKKTNHCWRAFCNECNHENFFYINKPRKKNITTTDTDTEKFERMLSCSIHENFKLKFANQEAFEQAINNKDLKYYCTECKKEKEPSDVIFVPTGRKKKSVKCRICQNKARRKLYEKQKAEK